MIAALREAYEEAGLCGRIVDPDAGSPERDPDRTINLATYSYSKSAGRRDVLVFGMEVSKIHKDWPDASWRERRWVPHGRVPHFLSVQELANVFDTVRKSLTKPMAH